MRILVAAERLGLTGGSERYLEIVLPELVARGATVHVLAREIDTVPAGVTAERIVWAREHDEPSATARVAAERALAAFAPDVAVPHNVMDAGIVEVLRAAPRLACQIHDHRPFCPNGDRVFPRTGRICTLPIGRACVVHSLTDGCAYGPRPRTLALIRRRERLRDAVAASDVVIFASRYVAELGIRSGLPAERVVDIPLPLPDEAYADRAGDPGSRAIVFAARVVPQKGLDSLVRAVASIAPERRPQVRAFGDGPSLADVRAEAARLEVELDAPGVVAQETIRAALDDAALAVLPSLWAEPFGYVGIEAFARGRPVVAYDVGGVRAWLNDGLNGITVRPGDESALGAAIDVLLLDDARRSELAQRARADAERFRAGPVVDALLSAYRG
jgi:glycosyltransferase involved in cell wall biosynthesis